MSTEFGIQVSRGVFAWIHGGVEDQARRVGDTRVLEYGRRFRALPIVFLVFWVGLFVLIWIGAPSNVAGRILSWGVFACFGAGSVYLLLETFFYRIDWREDRLRVWSPWVRRAREIALADVVDWRWGMVGQGYVLILRERGKRLRLSAYLHGAEELVRELRRRRLAASTHHSKFSGAEPPRSRH
jgi:hypothetical protein